jgi:hypothetical protein
MHDENPQHVLSATPVSETHAAVITYPAPTGEALSADYEVWADGRKVHEESSVRKPPTEGVTMKPSTPRTELPPSTQFRNGSRRKFARSFIALASLQLLGFAMLARADYGVESRRPLSDPQRAKIENRAAGTWRATINTNQYYLHVGTGNIVGKSDWMELVLVHPGVKPSFYVHHKIGFVSVIGGQSYFNVANLSVLATQLRGSKPEDLATAVERYDILKYEVNGDTLIVWAADQKFVKAAIEAGKIKGHGATIDDSMENLNRFIESSPPALWGNKFTYTRVK